MCLTPVLINNPSARVFANALHPFQLYVPCGHCAECQQVKYNEWQLRSYYEAVDCFNKNGFMFFDTLTYCDAHLPHLFDFLSDNLKLLLDDSCNFACFNHAKWRSYTLMFRRYFKFYFPNSEFKFFMSSEYGHDDRFTHRPHHHILYFIQNLAFTDSNCRLLSDISAKAWSFGRTDSYCNSSNSNYFVWKKHNFLHTTNSTELNVRCLTSYLSKYVLKDIDYDIVAKDRLSHLFGVLESCAVSQRTLRDYKNELNRLIAPFHRQSTQFGFCAVNYVSKDYIFKHNMLYMPDSQNVRKSIYAPNYFIRKLFYTLVVEPITGKKVWRPTADGVKFLALQDSNKLSLLVRKYSDYMSVDYVRDTVLSIAPDFNVSSFANYLYYYKGRVASSYIPDFQLVSELNSVRRTCSSDDVFIFHSNRAKENRSISPFVCVGSYSLTVRDFVSQFCISDRLYDLIFEVFLAFEYNFNLDKQRIYELNRLTSKKLKQSNIMCNTNSF